MIEIKGNSGNGNDFYYSYFIYIDEPPVVEEDSNVEEYYKVSVSLTVYGYEEIGPLNEWSNFKGIDCSLHWPSEICKVFKHLSISQLENVSEPMLDSKARTISLKLEGIATPGISSEGLKELVEEVYELGLGSQRIYGMEVNLKFLFDETVINGETIDTFEAYTACTNKDLTRFPEAKETHRLDRTVYLTYDLDNIQVERLNTAVEFWKNCQGGEEGFFIIIGTVFHILDV